MASGGPIQDHQGHTLWPVVGPFKAIGTKIYGQSWAHSRPSAPYAMAMDRPIEDHQHQNYGQWWAHSRPLRPCFSPNGPIHGHGRQMRTYKLILRASMRGRMRNSFQ